MRFGFDSKVTDADDIDAWDKWTRRQLAVSSAALWISAVVLVVAFSAIGLPASCDPGEWFQRSGAAVTLFCVYNQQLLSSVSRRLLPPAGFADMSKVAVWQKYMVDIPKFERLNLFLMLFATAVWGYGDLMRGFLVKLFTS